MTDQHSRVRTRQPANPDIDARVPSPARLYNYLAGGSGHFAADRRVADRLAASLPGGLDTVRAAVDALGAFVERAVLHLVDDAGLRQFLVVGVPVPAGRQVHEVAEKSAPDARVVYVGNDPVVLAHAHELTRGSPEGATAYVEGVLHDADGIWEAAGETLDLSHPVAVLVPVTLCLVADADDPWGSLRRLLATVPSGSHLVIAHATSDIPVEGFEEATRRLSEALPGAYAIRSRADIARFVEGLELVEPGLVQVDAWRWPADVDPPAAVMPILGAVARVP
ncbi:MAG TPA: SAM-dependent methyltransferase [Acidimicrobiales bacterium]